MVPGTSNHCSYHTDLLVFCLKFRLEFVCEYLNYYCNKANDYWAIPEEIQAVGLEHINFWKKLKFLGLSFNFENFEQNKALPLQIP